MPVRPHQRQRGATTVVRPLVRTFDPAGALTDHPIGPQGGGLRNPGAQRFRPSVQTSPGTQYIGLVPTNNRQARGPPNLGQAQLT